MYLTRLTRLHGSSTGSRRVYKPKLHGSGNLKVIANYLKKELAKYSQDEVDSHRGHMQCFINPAIAKRKKNDKLVYGMESSS